MSGRFRLQPPQQRAEPGLDALLGLLHSPLQRGRDLLSQRHHLVEGETSHHLAGDPFRLLAGLHRGVRRRPFRGRGGRARAEPNEAGQHLPRDARRVLAHALQDHLGQHDRRDVLAGRLVHHLDVVPRGDEPPQPLQGHVFSCVRVVKLAIPVPPDDAGPAARGVAPCPEHNALRHSCQPADSAMRHGGLRMKRRVPQRTQRGLPTSAFSALLHSLR